jgi:hypothetical protein
LAATHSYACSIRRPFTSSASATASAPVNVRWSGPFSSRGPMTNSVRGVSGSPTSTAWAAPGRVG